MAVSLVVYTNEDDALIFWRVPAPITNCHGFAIERQIKRRGSSNKTTDILLNRVGWEDQPAKKGEQRESTEWPFQRFSWTDHNANTGDAVSYRIIPMLGDGNGSVKKSPKSEWSDWSPTVTLGTDPDAKFRPFFNRGFVISQFLSRHLEKTGQTPNEFKKSIKDKDEKTIRHFLSGDLRIELLRLLKETNKVGGHIYAALFELTDDEVIEAICAFGDRAHLVLSNGSVQAVTGVPAAERRKIDHNKDARERLLACECEVEKTHRFLSPGALGHNKFIVFTDSKTKPRPQFVWTGSTNLAPTGLCTQVNNGIVINDKKIAKVYKDQWELLKGCKSGFTNLAASNSTPNDVGNHTVWFTRATKQLDLETLRGLVAGAKEGILFLMFQPGATGLLNFVRDASKDPNLYVRGVVSTLPPKAKPNAKEDEVDVTLIDGRGGEEKHWFKITQPKGIQHPFAYWAAEVTRKEFLSQVGHAIIHSKVIVIDPFGDDPIVVTGSHNFSNAASRANDENFIIIRGEKELAHQYAVNIMGAYYHYRWRAHVGSTPKPWKGLKHEDKWQKSMLKSRAAELEFFGLP